MLSSALSVITSVYVFSPQSSCADSGRVLGGVCWRCVLKAMYWLGSSAAGSVWRANAEYASCAYLHVLGRRRLVVAQH